MAFRDRSESKGKKSAPTPAPTKTKPYSPPYKVSQGDVKTNADRARAENYKSGKAAPSKGNPTYAQSVRAAYGAASPQARRAHTDKAEARSKLRGPKTFNGMDLSMSREDRIVLGEHARRVRQAQQAQTFSNPNNDIAADMGIAKTWAKEHPYDQSGRLQTGQTAYGIRPKSNATTQMAANHPGIETEPDRFVADVSNKINEALPAWGAGQDQTGRLPGDYSKVTGYHDPIKDIKQVPSDGGAGQIVAALDLVTNVNNIASQAGGLGRDAINSGLRKVDALGLGSKAALSVLPGGAILPWLAKSGDLPGNAFKDAVDVYAQAVPSIYQLGDAAVSAAGGDNTKLNEQVQGLKDIIEHPGKAFHDHPLLIGMMAKGGLSAVGRTGGAIARGAGRAAGPVEAPYFQAGKIRSAAQAVGRAGSTLGRDYVYLPGTNQPIARRYSHDIISKHLAQKPYDAFIRNGDGRFARRAAHEQAQAWEKRAYDEQLGGGEATRRLHRQEVNDFLTRTLPHRRDAQRLVPFIAERVVTNPERLRSDLEQRLGTLKREEKLIRPGEEGGPSKVYDNRGQQARIKELLDNDKLMSGGKHTQRAFEAATEMAHAQNVIDESGVALGHYKQEQVDKAKGFTYAIEHMGGVYDETPRPTARKVMKDNLDAAEGKAAEKVTAAKGKLDTAERHVRDEQRSHATIERRGKVPGGMERPLVLQQLDRELATTRSELRRARNRTEAAAERAGEATGSARVRSDQYDRRQLEKDPVYRKLRGEFSTTSQEKQAAQAGWRNAHEGGKELHSDADRATAQKRLDEATTAHDRSHANLHAHLDDVDAAAARGTTKMAGRSTSTTKAEAHFHTRGRAPERSLGRAERAGATHQAARTQRAALYERERHLERQIKKGEREASKLKSTDHERLRKLTEERDRLRAEHDHLVGEHDAIKSGNKMFGHVSADESSFTPGLTHPDGRQMTAADIDRHMKEVGKIEGGLADTMWFTHRPGLSARAAGMVPGAGADPQFEKLFTRTGEAARQGTYDNSIEALAASMTRSQGIIDAIGSRRRFIDTFVKPRGVDKDGTVQWYRDADIAGKASRDYNAVHGYTDKDPRALVIYQVTDARLDAARRKVQQGHLDPNVDKAIQRDHELTMEPSKGADQTGPGDYGLVTRGTVKRMRLHDDAARAGMGAFGEFTQKWRNAVLYGTSVFKWVFGNLAELTLRLGVAGAGPRAMYLGWKIMEETARQAGRPEDAAFIRSYLLGGGHFSGTVSRQIAFSHMERAGLRGDMQRAAEFPTVRHTLMAWNTYKKFISALNKKPELGGSYAAIGKLALKDRESWYHLQDGWKDAMGMSNDAITHVAKGLLDTPEQLRYARHVYDTIGRYTNLSPRARRWVGNFTPFGLWFANALKFGLLTIPRQHPLFGALLSASYIATQQDRDQLGQTLWAGDLPDFLQGTVVHKGYGPDGDSNHNYTRYLPFGAFTDPAGTASQQVLPQFSDFTLGFTGRNFTGNKQALSDGRTVRLTDRLVYATYTMFEGMIPFVSVAHQVAEKKGKPYMDDYFILHQRTKPGTEAKSYLQALAMATLPGYGYKNTSGGTGPSKTGGVDLSLPELKLPELDLP